MFGINQKSANPCTISSCERSCKAIDKNTGNICGETEGLQILNEFRKLYEDRIANADHETTGEFDRLNMKLQIMAEWVKDLDEQNVMLVHTVKDLEQAAYDRVKLLVDKLNQSSTLVSDTMISSGQSEEMLKALSSRICQLEEDEKCLQQKIGFLQNDIKSLLELIRRAKKENNWSLNGITFCEVKPNDIPISPNCTCDQEQTPIDQIECLKLQVQQLEANKNKTLAYQAELEDKVSDLTRKLCAKEETIQMYITKLQCLSNNLRKRSKLSNYVCVDSTVSTESEQGIILVADITENLVEKDLEIEKLQRQLQDAKSGIIVVADLQAELQWKDKELERVQRQMECLQKESTETCEALTLEVAEKHDLIVSMRKEIATLEEQNRYANMQVQFKDDIIKEMRKELKQATIKDNRDYAELNNTCVKKCLSENFGTMYTFKDKTNTNNCQNWQQDKVLLYLNKTKHLMEKEKEALYDLKAELIRVMDRLSKKDEEVCEFNVVDVCKKLKDLEALVKAYKNQLIDQSSVGDKVQHFIATIELQLNHLNSTLRNECNSQLCIPNTYPAWMDYTTEKLRKNISNISNMCAEREHTIAFINSAVCGEINDHEIDRVDSSRDIINSTITEQFKLMEEFRVCTVEAQAATEDIREEVNTVSSALVRRHKKYVDLCKIVNNAQEQLSKTREIVLQVIHKLELQEVEKARHNERILNEKAKLKKLKNEFNQAQSKLYYHGNVQRKTEDQDELEVCTCNDMLSLVANEIETVTSCIQILQNQECNVSSILTELKDQLCCVTCTFRDLQNNIDETLLENEVAETIFNETMKKLEKLEAEIDTAHTKMQDTLETLVTSKEQSCFDNSLADLKSQNQDQTITEILKAKEDLRKLRKEYDDFKLKALENTCRAQLEERLNQWKCKTVDLEDQLRFLQHEVKCKQEANNFLKKNIESIEQELINLQAKAENYRRCHSVDSMELKKKILELENTIRMQSEVECNLRKSLDISEMELKKSRELLNSYHMECGPEGIPCSGYQYKHEVISKNAARLITTLQDAVQSTKCGLQKIRNELRQLMCCQGSSYTSASTATLFVQIIDKLEKYEETLENCSQEIEQLRNTLYSKDKLLENMNQVVMIQKDSIAISQNELKTLYKKLQEKINNQDLIIAQHEKENKDLLKQNELQAQTIGHLQNAVVEAKRNLDSMGHKAMSDVSDVWSSISPPMFGHRNVHDV